MGALTIVYLLYYHLMHFEFYLLQIYFHLVQIKFYLVQIELYLVHEIHLVQIEFH